MNRLMIPFLLLVLLRAKPMNRPLEALAPEQVQYSLAADGLTPQDLSITIA